MRDKSSIALLICLMTLLSLTASVLLPQKADASSLLFTPPSQVTLTMYVLNNDGSIALGRPLCQVNDSRYGCTADSNKLYPFSSSNITIGIENHIYNSVQQGYLYNVTPHEVAIEVSSQNNKSLSTVKAQAIAARTFTYYNIFYSVPLNNSNDDQVYIPFTYDGLTSAQQQRVNQAVAEVIYMSTDGDTPISAHYGQDNDLWTSENENLSYLKSVYDPISAFYGTVSGTENGGMSSKGASRWGFGHTSSRGPVASSDPNYPGDNNGDGNFWSVRWDAAEQILAHY